MMPAAQLDSSSHAKPSQSRTARPSQDRWFRFSAIHNHFDKKPTLLEGEWDFVVSTFFDRQPFPARAKSRAPAWLPCVFGDRYSGQDAFRHDKNVLEVTALTFDLDLKEERRRGPDAGMELEPDDGDDMPVEDGRRERLAGREYVLHTTWSHTDRRPRWRLILPLAKTIGPDRLKPLLLAVAEKLGLPLDTTCLNPSRLYYLPAADTQRRASRYRVYLGKGRWLNPNEFIRPEFDFSKRAGKPPARRPLPERMQASKASKASTRFSSSTVARDGNRVLALVAPGPNGLWRLDDVARLEKDRAVGIAVARRIETLYGVDLHVADLEAGAHATRPFCSPLPWRAADYPDERPSAKLTYKAGRGVKLYDHGGPFGQHCYSLPELALLLASNARRPEKQGVEALVASMFLLAEVGVLPPAEVPGLPPCPEGVSPKYRAAYDLFKRLLGCKWRIQEWAGKPTQFTLRFLMRWCGIGSMPTAVKVNRFFLDKAVWHICGRDKNRALLFLPGPKPAKRQRPGQHRKTPDPKEDARLRRVLSKLGMKDVEPDHLDTRSVKLLWGKARRDPELLMYERELVADWASGVLRRRGDNNQWWTDGKRGGSRA
jgi:hypothetical protein